MDTTHEAEQLHLTETYQKLQEIHEALTYELEVRQKAAAADLKDMSEEIRPDFVGVDETMETLAAIETLNSVIDAYNQQHDFTVDKLRRVLLLLLQPYFAKVSLKMRPGAAARDIYIGAAGITDEKRRPLVVDWRSPVAETYYNQENGPTSYYVDGKKRDVVLELRRQFDITRDHLNSYFDTTVAIEDSLLLSALRRHHTEKLRDITATIQREQNVIVRHEDVPVMLVNGIAGSGKTSVMLQRIAFLFYQERETLSPKDVYLFTPNEVFESYIDRVLPSLGEANPQTLTWRRFVAEQGLSERNDGRDSSPDSLRHLERGIEELTLGASDVCAISAGEKVLLKPAQVAAAVRKFSDRGVGPRFSALVMEDLHERLNRALTRMSRTDEVQEEMLTLDIDEQMTIFGEVLSPEDEAETVAYARRYLDHLYGSAHEAIERAEWLRIDRIGMRILGSEGLTASEFLYLRLLLVGPSNKDARFVMVDEVQDYTPAQLMVMARYFSHAHFLLLGDEHQAIREGTASFDEIDKIFSATHGEVEVCRLLTSYRSSPEITALFSSLVEQASDVVASSVQREGVLPEVAVCPDTDTYLAKLRDIATHAHEEDGLTAIVANDRARAKWLAKQLSDVAVLALGDAVLPTTGVVVLDLPLAKGLEFDHVVIPDAQSDVYPDTPLARRQLYTAISRAMHRVSLVALRELSPVLQGATLA